MRYEHFKQPLLPRAAFYRRLANNALIAAALLLAFLVLGIFGYHFFEKYAWIDSLLNASMILGGMGPVDRIQSFGGKCFASFYAIFSGVVFLGVFAVLIAPVLHRFLHRFHLDSENEN